MWRAEGVKFACCLSSVLIKLFTFLRLWCQQFMTEACKMVNRPQTAKWYDGSSTDCLPAFPFTATTPDTRTHARTHTNTHALYHEPTRFNQVQQRDGNLTLSNLQLNLTPALTPLPHNRPAVDEQNETGGATATKKSALTLVTQKCNFTTLQNLITNQGQRKYFKSINEPCS